MFSYNKDASVEKMMVVPIRFSSASDTPPEDEQHRMKSCGMPITNKQEQKHTF